MGLIHILLALFLRPIVAIICVPYTIIKLLIQRITNKDKIGELTYWFHQLAFMLDLFGNYMIKYPANDLMLKKESIYKYGTNIKTISHITAFNYKNKTLTKFGLFVAKIMILCRDKAFITNGSIK